MAQDLHRPTARVLDILELLADSHTPLSLTEISKALGAPKSSLSPVIHTMESRNFLMTDDNGGYQIGLSAYLSGCSYSGGNPALDFIKLRMKVFTSVCQETCHLGVLTGGNVLYIAKVESPKPVTLRSRVGQSLPAYCTGLGKALLGGMNVKELRQLYPDGLNAYTPLTITSFRTLAKELTDSMNEGYFYEHGEFTDGIECIAVALNVDSSDRPIASMSVSVPSYRMSPEFNGELKNMLLEEKRVIERELNNLGIINSEELMH